MAMSSSERLRGMMEQNNRFVAVNKTRDQSEHTLMVQARASGTIYNRTPYPGVAIPVTKTFSVTDKGRPNNGIGTSSVDNVCARQVVTRGTNTFNERDAIVQSKQACAVCSDPDYSQNQNVAVDLKTLGKVVCDDHTKPPFSQDVGSLTGFPGLISSCKICGQRYFPTVSQPTPLCCTQTKTSLIDMKFGSAGVPQRGAAPNHYT